MTLWILYSINWELQQKYFIFEEKKSQIVLLWYRHHKIPLYQFHIIHCSCNWFSMQQTGSNYWLHDITPFWLPTLVFKKATTPWLHEFVEDLNKVNNPMLTTKSWTTFFNYHKKKHFQKSATQQVSIAMYSWEFKSNKIYMTM